MTRTRTNEAMLEKVTFGAHPEWATTAVAAYRDPRHAEVCRWALVRTSRAARTAHDGRLVRPDARGGTVIEELRPDEVPAGWSPVEVRHVLPLPADPEAAPGWGVRVHAALVALVLIVLPTAGMVGAAALERISRP